MPDLETRFRRIRDARCPNLWQEIEHRQQQPLPTVAALPPIRKLGIVVFAFLVASLGIGFAVHTFRASRAGPATASTISTSSSASSTASPTTEGPKPPSASTLDPSSVLTTSVSAFPEGIAVGEGGVWVVAGSGDGTGRADIVRLDPRTGKVVAQIPDVPIPSWEFGGAGIATGAGGVWVVGDPNSGNLVLTQIDPRTNAVAATIDLGPGSPADVWADASGIWVVRFTSDGRSLEVLRIDPTTQTVVSRIPVPALWSQFIFASGGSLWVEGTSPDPKAPSDVNTVYRIDPSTNQLVDTISIGGQSAFVSLAVDPDGLWATVPGGAQRFDTTTDAFVGPVVDLPPASLVSDGAGGAWAIGGGDRAHTTMFVHIDASGVVDRKIDVPQSLEQVLAGIADTFDPTTGALWVTHYKDSVSRVDLGG